MIRSALRNTLKSIRFQSQINLADTIFWKASIIWKEDKIHKPVVVKRVPSEIVCRQIFNTILWCCNIRDSGILWAAWLCLTIGLERTQNLRCTKEHIPFCVLGVVQSIKHCCLFHISDETIRGEDGICRFANIGLVPGWIIEICEAVKYSWVACYLREYGKWEAVVGRGSYCKEDVRPGVKRLERGIDRVLYWGANSLFWEIVVEDVISNSVL